MNTTPATNVEYNEAVFESDLNSNAKLLALAIGKKYNWAERRDCWPSNATLSKMTDLSIKSITRAKKVLVERGWITSTRRYDSTNIYRPTVPSKDWVYEEAAPETAVSPSEELVVSEEPVVISVPENPIMGQDEAPEPPVKPVEVVAEVPTKTEEKAPVVEGQAKTVIELSRNVELATVYYLDVTFEPGREAVVRAAMARTEADYDDLRFAPSFDDFGDETFVEYVVRMKNSETVNA